MYDMPSNAQYDALIELIARLIEAIRPKTPEEAAAIVRTAKTKQP